MTATWTVAEGRAQADRLRPLGITRHAQTPRIVCPDPTPEQLKRLDREQRRYSRREPDLKRARGSLYANGSMIIEIRVYANSSPTCLYGVEPSGRVKFMALQVGYGGYSYRPLWSVRRGERGKVVAERVTYSQARRILVGTLNPDDVNDLNRYR